MQTWLDGRTLHIRFNNPAKHNALSVDMWEAVPPLLRLAQTDDDRVRLVVFSGAGEKSFVSGADISQFEDMRAAREAVSSLRSDGRSSADVHPANSAKPTLACIRGYCIGGGVNVAISCDIRIATTDSVFSIPAARLGLGYRYSAMKNLVDLIGPGAAKDLFFTARRIDAAEAMSLGLVSRVCAPEALDALLAEYTSALADNAPLTIAAGQGDHARNPETFARTWTLALCAVADPRLLRERGLHRRPQRLHAEAQTGLHRPRSGADDAVLLDADDRYGYRAGTARHAGAAAGPGQLLVRMHAAALNRGEFVVGHGLHGKAGTLEGHRRGGRGRSRRVGAASRHSRPGDRVMGRCAGAFSEYALMEQAEAIAVPPACRGSRPRHPAGLPCCRTTCWCCKDACKAGEWLLINGVSSGVGVASLQLGKVLGAKVIGTSGSTEKLALLKPLGLDVGLCTRAADFAATVMERDGPARRRPHRQHCRRLGVRRGHSRACLRRPARHGRIRRRRG